MTTDNTEVVNEQAPPAEEIPVAEQGPSAEDMAAHDFKNLLPEFYKIVDFLPKKHLLRVIKALIEYPLETVHPVLSFSEEKKAFYLGTQINDCKFVLMKALFELAKDKQAMKTLQEDLKTMEGKKKHDL